MGTAINTNISASNALNSLNYVSGKLIQSQTRLATGKRINNAADDVAGYSIAKKLQAGSKGLGQALSNIMSDKNMLSVSEGHIKNILEILTKIRMLSVQGASDAIGAEERNAINAEFSRLSEQIDFEVEQASWGSQTLDAPNGNKHE